MADVKQGKSSEVCEKLANKKKIDESEIMYGSQKSVQIVEGGVLTPEMIEEVYQRILKVGIK